MTDRALLPPARRRWPRWSWRNAALLVSLILNLFLAGLIVGHTLGGPDHGRGFLLARFDDMLDHLPSARRDAARALLQPHLAPLNQTMEQLRDARRDFGQALTAPVLDPAAVATAGEKVSALTNAFQSGLQDAMLDLAGSLQAGERQDVFRPLLRAPPP